MPAGGPGGAGRSGCGAEHGFRRIRFLGLSRGRRDRAVRGSVTRTPARESANFQDIFSQWFGRQNEPQDDGTREGHRSRIRAEYRFLAGDSRDAGASQDQSPGSLRHVQRHRGARSGGNTVCPECNGSGTVTQMAGAMRFSLKCPQVRRHGRLTNKCPTCHGDGRISHAETVEVRIPPGAQQGSRLRVAGKGNAGTHGAPAGDLVHHGARRRASVFPARCATTF